MIRDERVRQRIVEKGYVPLAQPRWGPPSMMIDTRRNFEQMYEQYGKDPATSFSGAFVGSTSRTRKGKR